MAKPSTPIYSISNWTKHHMDAYLAIPQVTMEWIVENLDKCTHSLAASLYALWIGSRTVCMVLDLM
jgi:hypothetical protein